MFVFIFSKWYFHIHQRVVLNTAPHAFLWVGVWLGICFIHIDTQSCAHISIVERIQKQKRKNKEMCSKHHMKVWDSESSESEASRWMDGWKALGGVLIRGPKVLMSSLEQRGRQSSKVEMMALWSFWLGEKGSHLHPWLSRALGEPGNLMRWTLCQTYVMWEASGACNSEDLLLEIVGHLNCGENNPGDFSCATLVA